MLLNGLAAGFFERVHQMRESLLPRGRIDV
jgi:hypothetical protein